MLLELHYTIRFREERMVVSTSNIVAWMELGSPLTNDNIASSDCLTAILFDAQSFRLGVATVSGLATCLLMCHC